MPFFNLYLKNEKNMNLHEFIEIKHDIMLGKPVIRGTRIPVELIIRKLIYLFMDVPLAPMEKNQNTFASFACLCGLARRQAPSRLNPLNGDKK